MKNFPLPGFLMLAAFVLLASPLLRAQDAPPMDQGTPPPPEQVGAGPDQGGPPPDQGTPPDQGAPQDQGAPPDQGDPGNPDNSGASFQTFYDQLSSQGTWVQTNNYGYAWQPNVQDPNWAPYSNGHWVYTEDGWTWLADRSEPWGWATYHYGRWVNIDGEGWAWVPGYTWAPAWVSWRYGGGYCGWAPLPPETTVGIDFGDVGFGFHIGGDCDTAYDIGPGYYNFVPVGYIGAGNYRPYYVNRNNNFALINNTRNVTNIVVGGAAGAGRFGRVTTGGPNFATVNAQSRTPVQRASLVSSGRVGNASLQGNQLSVYAPRVSAATTARPRTVGATLSNATVNRGADISRPLRVNSRLAPVAASAQQVQAAQTAQARIPARAKVATTSTQLARPLTTPLTSLRPHAETRAPGATSAAVRTPSASVNAEATPRSGGERADSAFTGGNAERETHAATAPRTQEENRPASSVTPHESSFTPHAQTESAYPAHSSEETEERHASAPVEHQSAPAVQHEAAPVERHESAPMVQHESAPVERHESAPMVQHESAPVERHESAPAAAHPAAAQAQHQGSAPHPAAKPSGKPEDKKTPQ